MTTKNESGQEKQWHRQPSEPDFQRAETEKPPWKMAFWV